MPECDSKPLSDLEANQAEKSQLSDLSMKLMHKAFLRGAQASSSTTDSTMDSVGLRLSDYHTTVQGSEAEDSAQVQHLCPIRETREADEECEQGRDHPQGK